MFIRSHLRTRPPALIRSFHHKPWLRQHHSPMQVQQNEFPLRIIPKLPTFYSSNPLHESNINRLEAIIRKYIKLPVNKNVVMDRNRPMWISFSEYRNKTGGTRLKPTQYDQLILYLNKLNAIDKQLINDEIKNEINKYRRETFDESAVKKIPQLDSQGRSVAIGRRKSSSAKVYVVRGEGHILVNNRALNDYFVKLKDRESIMYPLQVIDSVTKYNIFALTSGGGSTGQADAIKLAIGKALVAFNPLLKSRLHKSGVLSRDYRHVERKKPGKLKARKMPTWVKR